MLALSVQQPYAFLILQPVYADLPDKPLKPIENRDWPLPKNFTVPQRIYVHAGLKMYDVSLAELNKIMTPTQWLRCRQPLQSMFMYYEEHKSDSGDLRFSHFFGKIIGEITITGCVTESDSPWFFGPYGFTLSAPKLYEVPIPCNGWYKFFNPLTHLLDGARLPGGE